MSGNPPLPRRGEIEEVLRLAVDAARAYVSTVDERPARASGAAAAARAFRGPLPETGVGAAAAVRRLVERGLEATVASSGPRNYHFVTGGTTPAAMGAEVWNAALDQLAYAWVSSPLAVELERIVLGWIAQLLELPGHGTGVLVSGATMANFVGLAAARQWQGERQGRDPAQEGLAGLSPVPVLSSGHVHPSAVKALAMLGLGRGSVRRFARDGTGTLDLDALAAALRASEAPAILIANAGEVNAGAFDPIGELADLAAEHGAWLHVDGAFGLFARVSPRTHALAAGAERADSICVDGHKWLNVPYDCGFALVRDQELLSRTFVYDAAYLPDFDDDEPVMGAIGPESSRRARSLAVWATLAAYGRQGVRAMVEGHLDLARLLARRVDEAPDLERLAEVPLCIVCFRFAPAGVPESELDGLNRRLGEALLADGRFYVGTTRHAGRTALRPALVNWRTRPEDVEAFVAVVRELGAALV